VSAAAGADRVIEAVGGDSALATAVRAAGPHATVVVAGAHRSTAPQFPSGHAFAQELSIRFTVGNPLRWRGEVLALMGTGGFDPSVVVTHRLPLAEAATGYRLVDEREALKVVLRP